MTVVGVTMVRDELDVLPFTLAHMLTQVDAVVCADNGSRDGTYEWLMEEARRLNGPLLVVEDRDVGYYQARKMTRLVAGARAEGATWALPFDADETWFARDGRRVADVLDELPPTVLVCEADLWDHVATALDPDEPNPLVRLGWRRPHASLLPKVAVRAVAGVEIAQGNHSATINGNNLLGVAQNLLTIRHFPYRDAAQTVRKVRNGAEAYAATDLPEHMGGHWRGWGRILEAEGEQAIVDLFRKWHYREDPAAPLVIDGEHQQPLVFDPAPIACPVPVS